VPFLLPRVVPVPAGRYGWTNVNAEFPAQFRWAYPRDRFRSHMRSFYDGADRSTEREITLSPEPLFRAHAG